MRLRPLTEAECYARCYGGRRAEAFRFVRVLPARERGASRGQGWLVDRGEAPTLSLRSLPDLETA